MAVKGTCFTNLDKYEGEKWPEEFVAVPCLGDRVEGESGRSLKVIEVTHMTVGRVNMGQSWEGDPKRTPQVRIELNK